MLILIVVVIVVFSFIEPSLWETEDSPLKAPASLALNPSQRSIEFNFEEMLDQGEAQNVEVVNGDLVLTEVVRNVYTSSGSWESPIFDTQNDYVFWDWVSGESDFQGMQENLVHDGDFEDPQCTHPFDNFQWPVSCGYYPYHLSPPFSDCTISSFGDCSARIYFNDSRLDNNGQFRLFHGATPETSYWFNVDGNKLLHAVFDLKYDGEDSGIEFWYTLSTTPNFDGNLYNENILSFNSPINDFEEQYVVINFSQYNSTTPPNYVNYWLFEYFNNDDYNNTAWLDNVRIFQDSPISYQVRTSADGQSWTEWTDQRYFVAEKTAPGGQTNRYIQFKINLKTSDISKTPRLSSLKLDYSKSFEFKIPWYYEGASVFDPILEPVGTHGFVVANEEGNLEFEDGTPARFWAAQLNGYDNAYSQWTEENSVSFCKKMRQMGFNMIKTDMYDNISGTYQGPLWEGFDNLLNACRDEGIYVYIQLNGVYPYSDEQYLEGNWWRFKTHINNFMNHTSNKTGIAYKDDPQIVFAQLLNEQTLHSLWRSNSKLIYLDNGTLVETSDGYTSAYGGQLNDSWREYISGRYVSFSELSGAWDDGTGDAFYAQESGVDYPNQVERVRFEDWKTFSDTRMRDTSNFYAYVQDMFYSEMEDYLRSDIRSYALIIDNNHYYGLSELSAREGSDVIDQHSYYGGPLNYLEFGEVLMQVPESKNPSKNIITYVAYDDIQGYPMTVSESNHYVPNLYAIELPLFISSYFSYQDWDQWTYFKLVPVNYINPSRPQVPEALNSWHDPGRMALMPTASRMFTEGYISPGQEIIELSHTWNTTHDYKYNHRSYNFNVPGLSNDFVFTNRVQRVDFNASLDKTGEEYYSEFGLETPSSPYVSDTGELVMDSDLGYFTFNAPKAQGFVGITPEETIELEDFSVMIEPKGNNFSAISLIPLDNIPILDSRHLLLSAAGRTESSTVKWTADKRGYDNPGYFWDLNHFGEEPVLVEGITSRIKIKSTADSANIYVLNSSGVRTNQTISSSKEDGWFVFDISDMYETLWYELILDTNPPGDDGNNNGNYHGGTMHYCGDSICDSDESCENCRFDCGICSSNEEFFELSGTVIDISSNVVEVITTGGDYKIVINGFVEDLVIYNVDATSVKISVNGVEYIVELGTSKEINVGGYDIYVSYLENEIGRAKLSFRNQWVNSTSSFNLYSIVYLIIYALVVLLVFFFMLRRQHKG